MANAKTYNELNQTSAVNASDLVAVAQADKTELQKTTVSDLANAVGELNQAGALAELSLATSIGKNLLAQRLTEKGVQNITPNNTLIEMADAVDKLAITNAGVLSDMLIPTQGVNNPAIPEYLQLLNNDLFISYNGKLCFIKDAVYSSAEDMVEKALYSIQLPDAKYKLYAKSSNDAYVAVQNGTETSATVIIYHNTGTSFELHAQFSVQNYADSATGISDDGNYVIFSRFGSYTQPYMYNIAKQYYGSFPISSPMQGTYVAMWDGNIFVRFAEHKNSTDLQQYQPLLWYTYTENEDGSITVTLKYKMVPNTPTDGRFYYINDKHYLLYTSSYSSYVINYKYYANFNGKQYTVTLVELETQKQLVFYFRTINTFPANSYAKGTSIIDSGIISRLEVHYTSGTYLTIEGLNTLEAAINIDLNSYSIISSNDYLTSIEASQLTGSIVDDTSYADRYRSTLCSKKGYHTVTAAKYGTVTYWYTFTKGLLGFEANMLSGKILYPIMDGTVKDTIIIDQADTINAKQVEIPADSEATK